MINLEHKNALIAQLTPSLLAEDFEDIFQSTTFEETSADRFIIRLELLRLGQPCYRIIDLRNDSDLPCEEFTHAELTHFLDEHAQTEFEQCLERYSDTYTLGVYESVILEHMQRKLGNNPVKKKRISNHFIQPLIFGNKPTSDAKELTEKLIFEDLHLNHTPQLPLFVSHDRYYSVSHILQNETNRHLEHYFLDKHGVSQINAFMNHNRLQTMIDNPDNHAARLFLCFTHTTSKNCYFYSASLTELANDQLLDLFMAFASHKHSFKMIRVHCRNIDHDKSYNDALLQGQKETYSKDTIATINKFSRLVTLTDITPNSQWYTEAAINTSGNANDLKRYAQNHIAAQELHQGYININERRHEARYAFKTQVTMHIGDQDIEAQTIDISSKGLQLLSDEAIQTDQHQIQISFPELQPLAGKASLDAQEYLIKQISRKGKILHLAAVNNVSEDHQASSFLKRLIAHNQDKLSRLTNHQSGKEQLIDSAKHLLMRQLNTLPLFFSGSALRVAYGATNSNQNAIAQLFNRRVNDAQKFEMSALTNLPNWQARLEALTTTPDIEPCIIFISQDQQTGILNCCWADQLNSYQDKLDCISEYQQQGQFYALQLRCNRLSHHEIEDVYEEQAQRNKNSIENLAIMKEQMGHISAHGLLIDISHEVLLLFPTLTSSNGPDTKTTAQ
ncbi:PilZ domain-containing protein [Shewanella marina]|uniref:PilZ domain-containing protein n=1 Tax=Shewanella marina TaxID=487319 RepID=UPI00046F882B|nr:PilZ domain-containing protein [Shewanella marina]